MLNREPNLRWGDLAAAIFLICAMIVATSRLITTDWIEDLGHIHIVSLFGVTAGLALGLSHFSRKTVNLMALVFGLFTIFWQLGLLYGADILWWDRLLSLSSRLYLTFYQAFSRQDINDPLLFLLLMALLFWVLSLHAGFSLTRNGNGWLATMPTGAVLFIIHINDRFWPFRTWYLGIFMVLALMIIARMAFLRMRLKWQNNETRVPAYVGMDLSRAALLVSVPLILAAWTVPAMAVSFPTFQENWQTISQPLKNRFDYLFSSLRATVGVVSDYYGDSLSLGRGNALSDSIVLTINAPSSKPQGARYYWYARSFDFYSSTGWSNTLVQTVPLSPEVFDQAIPNDETRWSADIFVRVYIPLRTIHIVPQPYSISRSGEAQIGINPDGSYDITSLFADPFLRPGDVYSIQSGLTNASQSELRAAGTNYPDWVTERYLQLPETITERTRELARRITADAETPYEKAQAITNYLRANITYTERIDPPPDDRDRVDWMLFEYQQAFCNYYASAEVVMLRSLGIPARMAVGYAEGEPLPGNAVLPTPDASESTDTFPSASSDRNLYVVRQRDLHAWPEVYFPGIGWVEFEPTVSQLPIVRPLGEPVNDDTSPGRLNDGLDPIPDDLPEQTESGQEFLEGLVDTNQDDENKVLETIILIATASAGFGLFAFALIQVRKRLPSSPLPVILETQMQRFGFKAPKLLSKWARLAELPVLTRAYLEINRALKRIGSMPQPADTPFERVNNLSRLIPPASLPASSILVQYEAQMYSPTGPKPGADQEASAAAKRIRDLSLQRWFENAVRPLRELISRF